MDTYRVADWMSAPPIVVASTMTLAAAQHLMEQHHVRRLPVVQDDRAIGVVSLGDLSSEAGAGSALADISAASPDR